MSKLGPQWERDGKDFDARVASGMVAACMPVTNLAKQKGQLPLQAFNLNQAAKIVKTFDSDPTVTVTAIEEKITKFIEDHTGKRVPAARRLRRAGRGVEHPHYSGRKKIFLTAKGLGRFVQSMRDPADPSQPHDAALLWSDLLNDVIKQLLTQLHELRSFREEQNAAREDLVAAHHVRAQAQLEAGLDVQQTAQGKLVPTGLQRGADGKGYKMMLGPQMSVEECCRQIGNPKKRSESASSKLTSVGLPVLGYFRAMSALHTRANIGKRFTAGLSPKQRNAIVVELENKILEQMRPTVCGNLTLHERMRAFFDQPAERRLRLQ